MYRFRFGTVIKNKNSLLKDGLPEIKTTDKKGKKARRELFCIKKLNKCLIKQSETGTTKKFIS
jgi:hypothetical protein